jgi:hypothetical protein
MSNRPGELSTGPIKRILGGLALIILCALTILFPMRDRTTNGVLAFVVGASGALLVYFGMRADRRQVQTAKGKRLPATEKEAITALVGIYRDHTEGFLTGSSSAEAKLIREIGGMLNEKGGMPAMLRVHEAFAASSGVYGAPRNLEHMWDGIGEWRG